MLGQSSVLAASHVDTEQKCACAHAATQVRRTMALSVTETEWKSMNAGSILAAVCMFENTLLPYILDPLGLILVHPARMMELNIGPLYFAPPPYQTKGVM